MDPTTKDKLATNVANSWKMASNYVMAAAGVAFTIYLALPPEQQQTLIQHLPVPPWVLPIVASVIGIVARLWPQKSITPAIAEAKSAAPAVDVALPTAPTPLSLRDVSQPPQA